jgi:hypothetical protein
MILLSSNSFGSSPELDGRPGGMMRLTLRFWVQRCRRCDYCARDLSADEVNDVPLLPVLAYVGTSVRLGEPLFPRVPPWTDERRAFLQSVVSSKPYRRQLKNVFFPRLANSFLCVSLLAEAERRYAAAISAALHAAWACDDTFRSRKAVDCRVRVIKLIEAAQAGGESSAPQLRNRSAILVDAFRRNRDFEAAASRSREALASESHDFLRRLLQFELMLANRQDAAAYTLAHVERWSANR